MPSYCSGPKQADNDDGDNGNRNDDDNDEYEVLCRSRETTWGKLALLRKSPYNSLIFGALLLMLKLLHTAFFLYEGFFIFGRKTLLPNYPFPPSPIRTAFKKISKIDVQNTWAVKLKQ